MAVIEVVKGGQKIENVVITTPQPMTPTGAVPPDIGYVEIGTSDDRGSIWMTGQGPPTTDAGQPGDMYLDMDTGDIWQWNGTEWELQGTFAPSTDTPEEVLAKLITVDGAGSLLDADTLDGHDSLYFATDSDLSTAENNITNLQADIDNVEAANAAQDTAIAGKANAVHTHPQSDITNLVSDLALKAPLASPVFTGDPKAPTPATADNDTSIATTAYVKANLASLPPSGIPEAPLDGKTYGRQSAAWAAVVGGAIVSDTPPASPQVGQMWFESDSGNTFIWYADADSSQWVQVNIQPAIATNPTAGLTAQTRNRICNPGMQISQENGSTINGSSGYYPADQWASYYVGTGVTSNTWSTTTAEKSIVLNSTSVKASLAAGDLSFLFQYVEGIRIADFGWGAAGAKAVVLQFTISASVAGTYSVAIGNIPATRSFTKKFTLAAGVPTTIVVPIPGCTDGTWATGSAAGLAIHFPLSLGSTYQAPTDGVWLAGDYRGGTGIVNGHAASGTSFFISKVGLYLDPLNTGLPAPWVAPDEAQELAACQRYWFTDTFGMNGDTTRVTAMTWRVYFSVPMRSIPAMSQSGATAGNCTFNALDVASGTSARAFVSTTTSGSWNYSASFQANARM